MTTSVTDVRSNPNDQIAHFAKALGRSEPRIAGFKAIHTGRQRIKTATHLAREAKLDRKTVLNEAKKLVHKQVVTQTTRDDLSRVEHVMRDFDQGFWRFCTSYNNGLVFRRGGRQDPVVEHVRTVLERGRRTDADISFIVRPTARLPRGWSLAGRRGVLYEVRFTAHQPDRMAIVIVGDRASIEQPLRAVEGYGANLTVVDADGRPVAPSDVSRR